MALFARASFRLAFCLAAAAAAVAPALAQSPSNSPTLRALPAVPPAGGTPTIPPGKDGAGIAAAPLSLSATFGGSSRPIDSGLVWRIYPESGETTQPLARSTEPAPTFRLDPGTYIVHVAYGMAGAVRRVNVGPRGSTEKVALNAGGLKLAGAIGGQALPANKLNFTIYVPLPGNSEGKLVASNVKPGDIVRLPEGTYHVVSNYGDTNAIMQVDLKVENGKVTEATLNHRAATVTLKLVTQPGGEALAGTGFSVLTPGGDVIREVIGAFPDMILAEGEYVVIARYQGTVYQRPFKVDSGLDREIEVLAQ